MKSLYDAARALYNEAFPGEPTDFVDALFALGFPQDLVAMGEDGRLISMLFALPYPILTENGPIEAKYLYAVATAKEFRGQGHAKRLLHRVASKGTPVFLRPMSPSLFDFYKSAGFTPFSPHRELRGEAMGESEGIRSLSKAEYLAARDALAPTPCCRMTEDFLSLSYLYGGAVAEDGKFAALYELDGDTVLFKEWWGDLDAIPCAAKFLGATHYEARFIEEGGTPFGVGVNLPAGCRFLAALD